MLYKRSGFPEENELVLCTITKVQFNSVFANLDEYGQQGMIHISEVAPGRIRNIRDYVKEGKKVVCKVLRVSEEKGHIDLSLRRVTEMQNREKGNWIKQEQKAEKIVEQIAKKLNLNFLELYNDLSSKIFKKYDSLHSCFESALAENTNLTKLAGIAPEISREIMEIIEQRFRPAEVKIGGYFKLVSYAPEGVEIIKTALERGEAVSDKIKINYLGAGKYNIYVTAPDYKEAERILEKATETTLDVIEKNKSQGEFVRIEK